MLNIYLFGPPRFERGGTAVHVSRRKVVALAAYLARTNRPASRETVAALLWSEHDQSEALKSLRRELARLKQELGREYVSVTRSHLAFNADAGNIVDVVRFQEQLRLVQEHDHFPDMPCPSCLDALTDAEQAYADDFMAGFNLPDCPEFDAWQDFQRESMRQELDRALHQLAVWYTSQRNYDRAIHYGRRRLALNPLHEAARRALMEVYAQSGQQAAALQLYDEGAELLQEEVGVAPAEASKRLWQAIRDGQMPERGEGSVAPAMEVRQGPPTSARRRRFNLPQHVTPFVGRSHELTMIQLRLQETACRLLTLVGPGGIGKTRLALEVGQRVWGAALPLFAGGVLFVPLEAVSKPEGIAPAMMEAAGISPYGNGSPEQQLLDFLRDRQMLFILDNLEHLLDGVGFITEILTRASGVRILATSRTALRLREEWFHPVGGLSCPPVRSPTRTGAKADGISPSLLDYDAIRLFVRRARHASPAFCLGKEEAHVVRICQLVEGMPLALELAAGWLRVLDARRVAEELEQSLDLLDARFRNLPERHRSIRAVFDQTWAMLDQSEREVLARLSVFRGSFSQEATARVAGATLSLLSDLIDKSLVQTAGPGRYRLHELLRQFAAEQLEAMDLVEESGSAHGRYYMGELAERECELKGEQQLKALNQIKGDLENVRMAWEWSLEQGDLPALGQALESIFLYYYVRGRNQQGFDFLQSARKQLAPEDGERPTPVWGRIMSRMSLMASLLSSPGREIEEQIQAALAVAREHGDRAEIAFCRFVEGFYHTLVRPDLDVAIRAYEEARRVYGALNDTFYLVKVLLWMGFCYGIHSRPDLDLVYSHRALALARAGGQKASVAHALGNLAYRAFCMGDYQPAEKYAHEVGIIGTELNLPGTVTHSRTLLCLAAFLRGDFEAAGRLAKEANDIALEINRPMDIGFTLALRGLHACLGGDYATGKAFAEESLTMSGRHFGLIMPSWALAIANCGLAQNDAAWQNAVRAIETASQAGFVAMFTWPLPVMAIVRARAGQKEEAVELLALAQTHPMSPIGWQKAWPLLAETRHYLEAALGAETFAAVWERGVALDLETTIAVLLGGRSTVEALL